MAVSIPPPKTVPLSAFIPAGCAYNGCSSGSGWELYKRVVLAKATSAQGQVYSTDLQLPIVFGFSAGRQIMDAIPWNQVQTRAGKRVYLITIYHQINPFGFGSETWRIIMVSD